MQPIIVDFDLLTTGPAAGPEQWQPLPGSLEAIARLTRADWRVLVIATAATGEPADLDRSTRLHTRLGQAAANAGGQIDAVFFCPHGPGQACDCCPPAPGLVEDIAHRQQLRPENLPCLVATEGRALEVARAAGARCLTLGQNGQFQDLDSAVQSLLDKNHS